MYKKLNLLIVGIAIFSLLSFAPSTSAKTVAQPTKKTQAVKKAVATKKVVAPKKVVKKVTAPVKKAVVKKTATKNIPMNQLPNPNAAETSAMKTYLQTINSARLTFKKEQAAAKTKEAKQAAETKYSQAVEEAMDLLSNKATPTPTNTSAASTSTNL